MRWHVRLYFTKGLGTTLQRTGCQAASQTQICSSASYSHCATFGGNSYFRAAAQELADWIVEVRESVQEEGSSADLPELGA